MKAFIQIGQINVADNLFKVNEESTALLKKQILDLIDKRNEVTLDQLKKSVTVFGEDTFEKFVGFENRLFSYQDDVKRNLNSALALSETNLTAFENQTACFVTVRARFYC